MSLKIMLAQINIRAYGMKWSVEEKLLHWTGLTVSFQSNRWKDELNHPFMHPFINWASEWLGINKYVAGNCYQ